jgi:hypothetical protein
LNKIKTLVHESFFQTGTFSAIDHDQVREYIKKTMGWDNVEDVKTEEQLNADSEITEEQGETIKSEMTEEKVYSLNHIMQSSLSNLVAAGLVHRFHFNNTYRLEVHFVPRFEGTEVCTWGLKCLDNEESK